MLDAFYDLNSCRPVGWGISPIPWTAIDQWAQRNALKGEQRELFEYCIREADKALIEHWEANREKT